jgi:hypothetical protein
MPASGDLLHTEGPLADHDSGHSVPAPVDVTGQWQSYAKAGSAPDPEHPVRHKLTMWLLIAVLGLVGVLIGLVGFRRLSVEQAVQLGAALLTPLFTLLGLAVAYYFKSSS